MAPGAEWPLVLLPGAVLAAVVALCWMLPNVSPPGVLFGVTVGPAAAEGREGARAIRLYRLALLLGVWAPVLLWALGLSRRSVAWLVVAALALVPEILVAYLVGHARARALRPPGPVSPPGSAGPAPSPVLAAERPPGRSIGRTLLGALGYLLLAASMLWLAAAYRSLPDPFPVHAGASGQPDRWAPKSPAVVFLAPAIGLGLMLFLELIRRLLRSPRLVHAGAYASRSARSVDTLLLVVQLFLGALLSLVALGTAGILPGWVLLAGALAAPLVLLCFLVGFVARLARERRDWPPHGDGLPDAAWKLGLVYFNAADPALLVPRRFGVGWTLNFARPAAWALLALLLGVPLSLALSARLIVR